MYQRDISALVALIPTVMLAQKTEFLGYRFSQGYIDQKLVFPKIHDDRYGTVKNIPKERVIFPGCGSGDSQLASAIQI